MSHHIDALFSSIIAWLNATGDGPMEISLPRRHYLVLAADLGVDDPKSPYRAVYDWAPPHWGASADPGEKTVASRSVRVPSSFIFNGPGGLITIREAP